MKAESWGMTFWLDTILPKERLSIISSTTLDKQETLCDTTPFFSENKLAHTIHHWNMRMAVSHLPNMSCIGCHDSYSTIAIKDSDLITDDGIFSRIATTFFEPPCVYKGKKSKKFTTKSLFFSNIGRVKKCILLRY